MYIIRCYSDLVFCSTLHWGLFHGKFWYELYTLVSSRIKFVTLMPWHKSAQISSKSLFQLLPLATAWLKTMSTHHDWRYRMWNLVFWTQHLKSVCYKGVRGVRGRVVSLRVRGEIHVLWSDLRWTFECLKGITALELACENPIWLHMLDIHPPNPHKSMADSRRAREQQVCCLC